MWVCLDITNSNLNENVAGPLQGWTSADIETSNGVIHVIDAVILPSE
jgi:uncharacterized surface protein with fasciclin (FAS1) repeats